MRLLGRTLGVLLLVGAATSPAASADITSGYIDYQLNGKHQRHGLSSFSLPSAYYTKSGDSETFGLKTSASNRMEHDTDRHYKTGTMTFSGSVKLYPGISQQSVVQVFGGGPGGPILMIKGYGRENGSLVLTKDTSKNLVTNAFSSGPIQVKIVHDTAKHRMTLSINGTVKWTGPDAGTGYKGAYNVKYGLYGTFKSATRTVWTDTSLSIG